MPAKGAALIRCELSAHLAPGRTEGVHGKSRLTVQVNLHFAAATPEAQAGDGVIHV